MTIAASLSYLDRLDATKIRFDLGAVRHVLRLLNNPQHAYPSVIVAGTNGKGSIAAMIAAILSQAGRRTGFYSSPHLLDVRERIRLDGEMIPLGAFADLIEETRRAVAVAGERITYFEFLTVAAFLYFWREQLDVAVLEVGMGGRLDATNVVTPLVAVISNISQEHQDYLGKRLADIAREKAGVIKPGVPCVTGARQASVLAALAEICERQKSPLVRLGREIRVRDGKGGNFSYHGLHAIYQGLSCPLAGRHQRDNAALAIGAVELLAERGIAVDAEAIRSGLEHVHWEGRLEILRREPALLVDGAHNPAGAVALRQALEAGFAREGLVLVFGVLRDKNVRAMLRQLLPLADVVILTRPASPRALPPSDIEPLTRGTRAQVYVTESVAEALDAAAAAASPRDLICVTGSLYLVGEVKRLLLLKEP